MRATCHDRHSYEKTVRRWISDSLTYSHNGDRSPVEAKTIVATYDYTDIKGKLLIQAVRMSQSPSLKDGPMATAEVDMEPSGCRCFTGYLK